KNTVEERGNQTSFAIKQLAADQIEARHCAKRPHECDHVKRFPIELACYCKYCGVRPEEKWRLALYRVNVGPTSVGDLVRHHRIHRFAVNWLRMQKRRKPNCNREEDYPKHGKAKFPRPTSWHIHHSTNQFPDGFFLRES